MLNASLSDAETTILNALTAAADAGDPAPTNASLGALAGRSSRAASEILRRLEAKGVIEVRVGINTRVVIITATGKHTAGDPETMPLRTGTRTPIKTVARAEGPTEEDIALARRIAEDQRRIRERRLAHLIAEQQRYRLPRMGRLVDDMAA